MLLRRANADSLYPLFGLLAVLSSFCIHLNTVPYNDQHRWPVFVGAHHKAGLTLMLKLFGAWSGDNNIATHWCGLNSCSDFVGKVCVQRVMSAAQFASLPTPRYFVHSIRDPMEVVVSAYQYHKHALVEQEPWLNVTLGSPEEDRWTKACPAMLGGLEKIRASSPPKRYQEYLQSVSTREGLLVEFEHSIAQTIAEMVGIYLGGVSDANTITLRLEDVSRDFNGTMERLFGFLGETHEQRLADVALASQFDLRLHPNNPAAGVSWNHVSTASDKPALRAVLASSDACLQIAELQKKLGYEPVVCDLQS